MRANILTHTPPHATHAAIWRCDIDMLNLWIWCFLELFSWSCVMHFTLEAFNWKYKMLVNYDEGGMERDIQYFFWRGPICCSSGWSLVMERQCVKWHMWHRGTIGLRSSSRYPCLWTAGLSSREWRSRAAKLQLGPVPSLLCGVGKQGWRGSPGERATIRIYIFIRDQSYVLFLSFSLFFFLSVPHTRMLNHWFTLSELDRPHVVFHSKAAP